MLRKVLFLMFVCSTFAVRGENIRNEISQTVLVEDLSQYERFNPEKFLHNVVNHLFHPKTPLWQTLSIDTFDLSTFRNLPIEGLYQIPLLNDTVLKLMGARTDLLKLDSRWIVFSIADHFVWSESSLDQGNSWERTRGLLQIQEGEVVEDFARHAYSNGKILCFIEKEQLGDTSLTLVASNDSGDSWEREQILFKDREDPNEFSYFFTEDGKAMVSWGEDEGFYICSSSDFGATWTDPIRQSPQGLSTNYGALIQLDHQDRLMLIDSYSNTYWISLDFGQSWGDRQFIETDQICLFSTSPYVKELANGDLILSRKVWSGDGSSLEFLLLPKDESVLRILGTVPLENSEYNYESYVSYNGELFLAEIDNYGSKRAVFTHTSLSDRSLTDTIELSSHVSSSQISHFSDLPNGNSLFIWSEKSSDEFYLCFSTLSPDDASTYRGAMKYGFVQDLKCLKNENGMVLISCDLNGYRVLFTSTDFGKTWSHQKVDFGVPAFFFQDLCLTSDNRIVVWGYAPIFGNNTLDAANFKIYSDDLGSSWNFSDMVPYSLSNPRNY